MASKIVMARLGQFGPALRAVLMLVVVLGAPAAQAAQSALERAVAATLIVTGAGDMPIGSAILLEDGLVLSAADVIAGRAAVGLRDAEGRVGQARVIARDGARGIVVLRLVAGDFGSGLALADSSVRLGQTVYAIGAPLGMEPMLTRGIVAAAARQVDPTIPMRALQHDAVINAGVAGGPLVDEDGRLLGMNRSSPEGALAGLGLAIPAGDLARLVPAMVAGTLRDVPDLGLALRRLTPVLAEALGLPATGLLVDFVAPGSRAANAGIVAGDVVLGFDGAVLSDVGTLAMLIDGRIRQTARLDLRRGDVMLSVVLDLAPVQARLGALAAGVAAVRPIASYSFATLGVTFEDRGRVGAVNLHSPAFSGGLRPGDTVIAVNGIAAARAMLDGFEMTGPVLLLVSRGGTTLHILIDPWGVASQPAAQTGAIALDARAHLF